MSLAEKINIDVKNALKAGDKKLLAVSRNVLSELKNLLIKENLERDISKITNGSFQKVIKTIVLVLTVPLNQTSTQKQHKKKPLKI